MYDNAHTIFLYNEGNADILMRFYPNNTTAFDLNTVSTQVYKIAAKTSITLSIGTGTSSPGARYPLYSIVTAGSTTDLYISYLCRCTP